MPIVVPELELRNVERHVFGADFVEAADDARLNRPEAFNRVRVDCADNELLDFVPDNRLCRLQEQIANIGCKRWQIGAFVTRARAAGAPMGPLFGAQRGRHRISAYLQRPLKSPS